MIVDEALAEVLVFGDQSFGMDGKVVLFDDADGCDETRHNDDEQDDIDCCFGQVLFCLACGFNDGETEILHCSEGGQGDEYTIDEKEIECAKDDGAFPDRDAVAHGTEGRHECRGNGHASDDTALVFA